VQLPSCVGGLVYGQQLQDLPQYLRGVKGIHERPIER
jgi:hypothetical protein